MAALPLISDSPASALENPPVCPQCGASTRVARGTCANCLLQAAADCDVESSREEFDRVLAEAEVPDTHWQLGNYQILGEIGRGGMGVIYRARQRHSRRIVALKRVLGYHADSHERLERFRRETEAAASLDHPNILPIYEVGHEDGAPFFSMKWATGGSLREAGPALREDPRACVTIIAKVARAIHHAHEHGILHRDLQPGNILLDSRGEPHVSDFGLAKIIGDESELTCTISAFGTPGFMAPEQSEGNASAISPAADVYSLGAILFQLLAGRPPFLGGNALSVLRRAAETPAPRLRAINHSLDRDLEIIIAHCLEREPKARYQSAADLADELERWLDGRPIQSRRVLLPTHLWRWSRRNPILAGAITCCLALATAVISLLWTQPQAPIVGDDKSIAVLPFENLNPDGESEFFAAGMQEDILTSLAHLSELKVISASSTRTFQPGKPRDLSQVGRDLNVRYVLEGNVRRANETVRMSVHLTDTSTGARIWADDYESDLPGVFGIQTQIAKQIADQLQAHLSPGEEAALKKEPTKDMVAYDLYLRAKEIADRPGLTTAERTTQQVELLGAAVGRDPAFGAAFCLLSRAHVLSYWSNHDHSPARLKAAHRTLDAAAQLEPENGEVHLARGILYYWGHRDYVPALAELRKARARLPNNAEVPYFVGLIERRQGQWDESTRHLEEACTLDPRNEVILFDLARTNYFALKRYREAAETCEGVLKWKPDAFDFILARAKVDLSSRADTRRWEDAVWGPAAKNAEPELLAFERLDLALTRRDYQAARQALEAQALPEFNWAGYVTPRAFYEGLIAQGLGETEAAHKAYASARDELSAIIKQRPDDAKAHIILAQIEARDGRKAEAIAAAQKAMQLRPPEKDAVDGPAIMCIASGVYALVGDNDAALNLLERVATMPFVTNYGGLKLDTMWDSLRSNPRFERILALLGPKEDLAAKK